MGLAVGEILEGKITGITKFGAFVALPEGKSGMVHISEVANSYVNDIKDFVKIDDAVRVKVINIDDQGRINLSIKRAQEQPRTEQAQPKAEFRPRTERRPQQRNFAQQPRENKQRDPGSMTFEDKLKMFMADSESRMADIRHNTDRKNGSRRRK
ncbi:MAG: S1 RNA-binding domain-containing protein [Butyricicoccus sp.]|nr:S1 RNA-binding domain-containing protein [Butyricicoccus sp.]